MFHHRSKHKTPYDFNKLVTCNPALQQFLRKSEDGDITLDYAYPNGVLALNKAILKHDYGLEWSLPPTSLCPGVPGRAEYIHQAADLVNGIGAGPLKMLDIGTGASGIYMILARVIYQWHCVGSDISLDSLKHLESVIASNTQLDHVELRQQKDKHAHFTGIIQPSEYFHLSVCNPPFFDSAKSARRAHQAKAQHLNRPSNTHRNFSGTEQELWCNGGEALFIKKMIRDSCHFKENCQWFTTLVSQTATLNTAKKLLRKVRPSRVIEIPMSYGNKKSRILAWSFQSKYDDRPS